MPGLITLLNAFSNKDMAQSAGDDRMQLVLGQIFNIPRIDSYKQVSINGKFAAIYCFVDKELKGLGRIKAIPKGGQAIRPSFQINYMSLQHGTT
jgi:hypothetical protein